MQFATFLIVLSQRSGLLFSLRGKGVPTMPSMLFVRLRKRPLITREERPGFSPIITSNNSPQTSSFEVVVPSTETMEIICVRSPFRLPLTTGKTVIKFHNMVDIALFRRDIASRKTTHTVTGTHECTLRLGGPIALNCTIPQHPQCRYPFQPRLGHQRRKPTSTSEPHWSVFRFAILPGREHSEELQIHLHLTSTA